jgi:hypothetical protein
LFFKGSRYAKVKTAEVSDGQGRLHRYKLTRRISEIRPSRLGHAVRQGERLDHIAHRYYRDPERFWRICDANLALWPDDLIYEVGGVIRIPSAED